MSEYGCWFCRKGNTDCFTMEWDCEVHEACVYKAFAERNIEAEIIMREWGELPEGYEFNMEYRDDT